MKRGFTSEKKYDKTKKNSQRRKTIHETFITKTPYNASKINRKPLQVVSASKTNPSQNLLFSPSEPYTSATTSCSKFIDSLVKPKSKLTFVSTKSSSHIVTDCSNVKPENDTSSNHGSSICSETDNKEKHCQSKLDVRCNSSSDNGHFTNVCDTTDTQNKPKNQSVNSSSHVIVQEQQNKLKNTKYYSVDSQENSSPHFVSLRRSRKLDFVVKDSKKKQCGFAAKSKPTFSGAASYGNDVNNPKNHTESSEASSGSSDSSYDVTAEVFSREKNVQLEQQSPESNNANIDANADKSKQEPSCLTMDVVCSDDEKPNSLYSDCKTNLLPLVPQTQSPKIPLDNSGELSNKPKLKTFRKTNSGKLRKSLQEARFSALKNQDTKKEKLETSQEEIETIILPATPEQEHHTKSEFLVNQKCKDWMHLFDEPFPRRSPRLSTLPTQDPQHYEQLLNNLSPLTSRETTRKRKTKSLGTPRNTLTKMKKNASEFRNAHDADVVKVTTVSPTVSNDQEDSILSSSLSMPRNNNEDSSNIDCESAGDQKDTRSALKRPKKERKSKPACRKKGKKDDQKAKFVESAQDQSTCSSSFVNDNTKDVVSFESGSAECKKSNSAPKNQKMKPSHVSNNPNNTPTNDDKDANRDGVVYNMCTLVHDEEMHFPKPSKDLCKPGGPLSSIIDFCLPDKDFAPWKLAKLKSIQAARKMNSIPPTNLKGEHRNTVQNNGEQDQQVKSTAERTKTPKANRTACSDKDQICSPKVNKLGFEESRQTTTKTKSPVNNNCHGNEKDNECFSEQKTPLSKLQERSASSNNLSSHGKSLPNSNLSDTALQNSDSGSCLSESILAPLTVFTDSKCQEQLDVNSDDCTITLSNSEDRKDTDSCSKSGDSCSDSRELSQSIFHPLTDNGNQSHDCVHSSEKKNMSWSTELNAKQFNAISQEKSAKNQPTRQLAFNKGYQSNGHTENCVSKGGSQGNECVPSSQGSLTPSPDPTVLTCLYKKQNIGSPQSLYQKHLGNISDEVHPKDSNKPMVQHEAGLNKKQPENRKSASLPSSASHENDHDSFSNNTQPKNDDKALAPPETELLNASENLHLQKSSNKPSIMIKAEKVKSNMEDSKSKKYDSICTAAAKPQNIKNALNEISGCKAVEFIDHGGDITCALSEETDDRNIDSQDYEGSFPLCSNTEEFAIECSTQPDIQTTNLLSNLEHIVCDHKAEQMLDSISTVNTLKYGCNNVDILGKTVHLPSQSQHNEGGHIAKQSECDNSDVLPGQIDRQCVQLQDKNDSITEKNGGNYYSLFANQTVDLPCRSEHQDSCPANVKTECCTDATFTGQNMSIVPECLPESELSIEESVKPTAPFNPSHLKQKYTTNSPIAYTLCKDICSDNIVVGNSQDKDMFSDLPDSEIAAEELNKCTMIAFGGCCQEQNDHSLETRLQTTSGPRCSVENSEDKSAVYSCQSVLKEKKCTLNTRRVSSNRDASSSNYISHHNKDKTTLEQCPTDADTPYDSFVPTTPYGKVKSAQGGFSEESPDTEPSIGDTATPSGKANIPMETCASVSPCGMVDDDVLTPILLQACLQHPTSDSSKVQSISMYTYNVPGNTKREVLAVCLSHWIVLWIKAPRQDWTVLNTWTAQQGEVFQKVHFLPSSSHLILFVGGSLTSSVARIFSWSGSSFQNFTLECGHVTPESNVFKSMCVVSKSNYSDGSDLVIATAAVDADRPIVSRWTLDALQCKDTSSLPVPRSQSSVMSISTVDGNSYLLIGLTTDALILWNHQSCSLLKEILLPSPGLHSVDYLHTKTQMGLLFLILVCKAPMLKTSGYGSFIIALNPKNSKMRCLNNFTFNSHPDRSMNCGSGCGQYIALGQDNGDVCLWNILSPQSPVNVPIFQGQVDCISFHPSRPIVAIAGGDTSCIHLYSLS